MIAATVLAAGISARMGSAKALLPYRDRTFLATILGSLGEAGIRHQVVVVGESLLKELSPSDLRDLNWTMTTEPQLGPIGSIRSAIRHFGADLPDALLVWPVDLPHVQVETVRNLVEQAPGSGQITVPCYRSRRGHPIMINATLFPEILQLGPDDTMKTVVRADPSRVREVQSPDSAVIDSINTPGDYERLVGQ